MKTDKKVIMLIQDPNGLSEATGRLAIMHQRSTPHMQKMTKLADREGFIP
jgi:hypothetical protein